MEAVAEDGSGGGGSGWRRQWDQAASAAAAAAAEEAAAEEAAMGGGCCNRLLRDEQTGFRAGPDRHTGFCHRPGAILGRSFPPGMHMHTGVGKNVVNSSVYRSHRSGNGSTVEPKGRHDVHYGPTTLRPLGPLVCPGLATRGADWRQRARPLWRASRGGRRRAGLPIVYWLSHR